MVIAMGQHRLETTEVLNLGFVKKHTRKKTIVVVITAEGQPC